MSGVPWLGEEGRLPSHGVICAFSYAYHSMHKRTCMKIRAHSLRDYFRSAKFSVMIGSRISLR